MIKIEVDDAVLGATVVTTSPLRELVASLFLLRHGARWPYDGWAVAARQVLRRDDRTLPLNVFGELSRGFPSFLCQTPQPGANTLTAELARLRKTPAREVHEQLDHYYGDRVPEHLMPYRRDPELALHRLADAFAAYWEGAMKPIWPTVQALTDGEVMHRAKAMAQVGAEALFEDLHSRITWRSPQLELDKPLELDFAAGVRRLQLVPLVFADNGIIIGDDDPDLLTLPFQVRGAAALAETRDRPAVPDDRLDVLVGRGRAALLRQLAEPTTTHELAARLAAAPSTISEHLSVLVSTDVVSRHRVGRRVYYRLTDSGRGLLDLFDRATGRAHVA
ncbi:ArsR family transcriptional regulator [Actinoplanes sp. NPDC051346]|uniref:ArsR/SmtB family transcription factor n=1 Tax=Actinoplanes sp. NPDC051346 TaxID=3155048 RepID=UPI0034395CEF